MDSKVHEFTHFIYVFVVFCTSSTRNEQACLTFHVRVPTCTSALGHHHSRSSEVTAKTQFEKTYKGNVCIEECSPDGSFVEIANIGSKKERLNGWRVRRVVDETQTVQYTIMNLSMNPGQTCRLWAKSCKPREALDSDIETGVDNWKNGNHVITHLYNEDGVERAMHLQKTVFT